MKVHFAGTLSIEDVVLRDGEIWCETPKQSQRELSEWVLSVLQRAIQRELKPEGGAEPGRLRVTGGTIAALQDASTAYLPSGPKVQITVRFTPVLKIDSRTGMERKKLNQKAFTIAARDRVQRALDAAALESNAILIVGKQQVELAFELAVFDQWRYLPVVHGPGFQAVRITFD